jgi:hypothetical protein
MSFGYGDFMLKLFIVVTVPLRSILLFSFIMMVCLVIILSADYFFLAAVADCGSRTPKDWNRSAFGAMPFIPVFSISSLSSEI